MNPTNNNSPKSFKEKLNSYAKRILGWYEKIIRTYQFDFEERIRVNIVIPVLFFIVVISTVSYTEIGRFKYWLKYQFVGFDDPFWGLSGEALIVVWGLIVAGIMQYYITPRWYKLTIFIATLVFFYVEVCDIMATTGGLSLLLQIDRYAKDDFVLLLAMCAVSVFEDSLSLFFFLLFRVIILVYKVIYEFWIISTVGIQSSVVPACIGSISVNGSDLTRQFLSTFSVMFFTYTIVLIEKRRMHVMIKKFANDVKDLSEEFFTELLKKDERMCTKLELMLKYTSKIFKQDKLFLPQDIKLRVKEKREMNLTTVEDHNSVNLSTKTSISVKTRDRIKFGEREGVFIMFSLEGLAVSDDERKDRVEEMSKITRDHLRRFVVVVGKVLRFKQYEKVRLHRIIDNRVFCSANCVSPVFDAERICLQFVIDVTEQFKKEFSEVETKICLRTAVMYQYVMCGHVQDDTFAQFIFCNLDWSTMFYMTQLAQILDEDIIVNAEVHEKVKYKLNRSVLVDLVSRSGSQLKLYSVRATVKSLRPQAGKEWMYDIEQSLRNKETSNTKEFWNHYQNKELEKAKEACERLRGKIPESVHKWLSEVRSKGVMTNIDSPVFDQCGFGSMGRRSIEDNLQMQSIGRSMSKEEAVLRRGSNSLNGNEDEEDEYRGVYSDATPRDSVTPI